MDKGFAPFDMFVEYGMDLQHDPNLLYTKLEDSSSVKLQFLFHGMAFG